MTTPETGGAPGATEAPTSRDGSRLLPAMAAVLALLAVAGLVVAWTSYGRLQEARSTLEARSDVTGTAERFVVQFNTYEPGSVDGYTAEVEKMLTTSAKTAFGNQVQDIAQLIRETDLESSGEVLASAVAHVDQDDATVLVVADAETNSTAGPTQRHFRWEIDLQKVDGTWLVDDFNPVA